MVHQLAPDALVDAGMCGPLRSLARVFVVRVHRVGVEHFEAVLNALGGLGAVVYSVKPGNVSSRARHTKGWRIGERTTANEVSRWEDGER